MAVHRPIIAAHRGGALLWPENSMTAFRGALTLPIDQIETDVRLSADGEPFILHDALLDRTTEATGVASELLWAELTRVRLKQAELDTIPHLDELLVLLKHSAVDLRLELKANAEGEVQPGLAETVLTALSRHDMTARTTVTSFDLRYLAQVAKAPLAGRIWLVRRALLAEHGIDRVIAEAARAGLSEMALHIADCDALNDRATCPTEQPRFGFFAVNDVAGIAKAIALHASAFTTDRPDLAVAMGPGREMPRLYL